MRVALLQLLVLSVSAGWPLCGQQAKAQDPTIAYTFLTNPDPVGIFNQEEFGVVVYHSHLRPGVLPVDLNHDGVVDYLVVADEAPTLGFHMEGAGTNAVWVRLTGGNDFGGFIRPLLGGTEVGEELPAGEEWLVSWEFINPAFSAYSSAGALGLFQGQLAYAGLKFYVDGEAYYGWIKVQEIPSLAGGGIVYEYACETRPNTPIAAGAGTPIRVEFSADCSGINEVPRNNSTHAAQGSFTLVGHTLVYRVVVDLGILPANANISGPANPDSISRHQITGLAPFTPFSLPVFLPAVVGYMSRGQVTLNEKQIVELLAGRFYVNVASAAYPRGEIRGAILPDAPIQFAASFSGANEIPRNSSRFHGVGSFVLTGNQLAYHLALDAGILPVTAGIYGCPPPRARRADLVSPLDISIGVLIPAGGISGEPGVAGQVLYRGEVNLTDQEVLQLKRGELFADFFTGRYPRGEVSGQILPTDADQDGVPDYLNDLIEQFCPCEGSWTTHAQYVAAVRDVAAQFVAARLITVPQFWQIVRAAQRSNCGPDQ